MNQVMPTSAFDLANSRDGQVTPIRKALGDSIGKVLTPEIAVEIEVAHVKTLHRQIERFEDAVIAAGIEPVNCRLRHHFAHGVYGREVSIPANVTLTGAVHKVENIVIVSRGRIEIATPAGRATLLPGDTITCAPGTKNMVVALEDSQWTNFYPNPENLRDPDALVECLYEARASELLGGSENRQTKSWADAQEVIL